MIEVDITKKGKYFGESFKNRTHNARGDVQVLTSRNKNVEPSLKLCIFLPSIANNNINMSKNGCGNGMLCRFKGIEMKDDKTLVVKKMLGKKFT